MFAMPIGIIMRLNALSLSFLHIQIPATLKLFRMKCLEAITIF